MADPIPGNDRPASGKAQKASYTPSAAINPFAYGKDGGKASFDNPPSIEANGSVVGQVPAMPGMLRIGEDMNVSTPVSG